LPTLQLEPVGTAMIFYGLVLFMFSWQLFGKVDAKAAGYVVFAGGFVGLVMGLFTYIALGLALPGTLVIVFAVTFMVAGYWSIRGLDPKTLAYFLLYLGIVDAIYAVVLRYRRAIRILNVLLGVVPGIPTLRTGPTHG